MQGVWSLSDYRLAQPALLLVEASMSLVGSLRRSLGLGSNASARGWGGLGSGLLGIACESVIPILFYVRILRVFVVLFQWSVHLFINFQPVG